MPLGHSSRLAVEASRFFANLCAFATGSAGNTIGEQEQLEVRAPEIDRVYQTFTSRHVGPGIFRLGSAIALDDPSRLQPSHCESRGLPLKAAQAIETLDQTVGERTYTR